MAHRVAAWESMPWEAGGRGGCRAWRKDGRHERQDSHDTTLRNAKTPTIRLFVTAKVDSPPLVESRPVTGPQPLYQPLGDP